MEAPKTRRLWTNDRVRKELCRVSFPERIERVKTRLTIFEDVSPVQERLQKRCIQQTEAGLDQTPSLSWYETVALPEIVNSSSFRISQ